MSDGAVVDANIMAMFTKDFLAEYDGPSRALVEKLTQTHGFAIDIGGKIQNEWFSTCGVFFKEWFVQQMKLGNIRVVKSKIEMQHKKALRTKLGMPGGCDLEYIAVANVTAIRYIVTEDIHFFDPCLKLANAQAKEKARESRTGPVCAYLRKSMRIRVGRAGHALNDLFPPACA